jgi:hypothetical protein
MPRDAPAIAESEGLRFIKSSAAVAYGAVIVLLVVHFVLYLRYALTAVQFPFELDYGEGIVWQQALLIPGERMYGDITRFPFIVFHYPPLYHLAVRAMVAMGGDALMFGRAISVLCTLLIGGLVAALAYEVSGPRIGRAPRLIGSAVAGLTVFCYWPVVCWSPMMRVDMLAIMLSFLGVWLAGQSASRPWLIFPAVLSFVLAVYTKQTSIAAPLAVSIVGFMTDRRRTLWAFGFGLVSGLVALLVLSWETDGGFVRHLLLYNLNRFSFRVAAESLVEEWPQVLFLVLALGGLVAGWRRLNRESPELFAHREARLLAILTLWLVFATGMLFTLGKSGSKLNYLIEWMCVWSVLIGLLVASVSGRLFAEGGLAEEAQVRRRGAVLALLVPIALLAQVIIMPTARDYRGGDQEEVRQLADLVVKIRDARQPVLSDDMVLLLKAGKEVPWEPAIFAELASTGRWDEQLIGRMIATREFAFIITRGHRGEELYDSRFTPAIDRAIHDAYPRTEEVGGRTLHLPAA